MWPPPVLQTSTIFLLRIARCSHARCRQSQCTSLQSSNPAYTHSCRSMPGSMSFWIMAPSKLSLLGMIPIGTIVVPFSSLRRDFCTSVFKSDRDRCAMAPYKELSSEAWFRLFDCLEAVCVVRSALSNPTSRRRLPAKPSSDSSHDRASGWSEAGARLARISAASIPCKRYGFRDSTRARVWLELLGIGEIASPKVLVRSS